VHVTDRQPMVAGNWKLNGTRASAVALADSVARGLASDPARARCVLCPSFVHLDLVHEALAGSDVALGGQDCSATDEGAYTGEVSAAMLGESGCTHVIVGHSERRALFAETSETVAIKALAVQAAGLTPILCVGETLAEREAGRVDEVVGEQLDALLASSADGRGVGAFGNLIVAYEPVWAIGTGKTASPDEAQAVHRMIRERVAAHDRATADALVILYGGSVKPDNAATLFGQADIDGGLVGGAALDADAFLAICRATRQAA